MGINPTMPKVAAARRVFRHAQHVRSLVIGGSGLVGLHMAAALRELGEVRATYRTWPAPGLEPLDIRDRSGVEARVRALGPELVVCAAADAHVDGCERDPVATHAVNVQGVANVVDAAIGAGATVMYFSSDYVFDGAAGPYAEDDPLAPINEYGRQKVEAERIVRSAPSRMILRTSGVFGWEPRRKNFVCQVIDRLRVGSTMSAADDQILCPTWAVALAEAARELVAAGARGVVHVVGPEALTRAAFARRIAHAFDLDERLVRAVTTPELGLVAPRPRNSALRDDRLRQLLGRPLPRVERALAEMRATEVAAP